MDHFTPSYISGYINDENGVHRTWETKFSPIDDAVFGCISSHFLAPSPFRSDAHHDTNPRRRVRIGVPLNIYPRSAMTDDTNPSWHLAPVFAAGYALPPIVSIAAGSNYGKSDAPLPICDALQRMHGALYSWDIGCVTSARSVRNWSSERPPGRN